MKSVKFVLGVVFFLMSWKIGCEHSHNSDEFCKIVHFIHDHNPECADIKIIYHEGQSKIIGLPFACMSTIEMAAAGFILTGTLSAILIDAVFRTVPLLYHKFENMAFFESGNLYSLCSPGNQDYQNIIHF